MKILKQNILIVFFYFFSVHQIKQLFMMKLTKWGPSIPKCQKLTSPYQLIMAITMISWMLQCKVQWMMGKHIDQNSMQTRHIDRYQRLWLNVYIRVDKNKIRMGFIRFSFIIASFLFHLVLDWREKRFIKVDLIIDWSKKKNDDLIQSRFLKQFCNVFYNENVFCDFEIR